MISFGPHTLPSLGLALNLPFSMAHLIASFNQRAAQDEGRLAKRKGRAKGIEEKVTHGVTPHRGDVR